MVLASGSSLARFAGAEGAILENFSNVSENLFLENEIKSKSFLNDMKQSKGPDLYFQKLLFGLKFP